MDDRCQQPERECGAATRAGLDSHRNGLRLLYREAFGDAGEFAFVEYVTLLPSMGAFSNNVCLGWLTDRLGGRLVDNARAFDDVVAEHAR